MRKPRSLESIGGRVNADGSIQGGSNFTVLRTQAGLYIVTLAPGFRLISATANVMGQYEFISVDMYTERSFRVTISSTVSAFTATDQPFTFTAVGG